MSLIFDSYSYKYGDYGLNNGSIFDINISGSSSYSATWYGPIDRFGSIGVVSGFTNLSNTIKHPDLVNLYPGVYSGYSYDNSLPSSSATTTVEIFEREKLVLDVSLYDDSCLRDDSLFCTLRVNDFNHDVNNFVYNLYVNGSTTPSKVYNGSNGNELYDFTGLTANNKYNVEAYETDEIVYIYKNIVECVDGNVDIENGTDPINIVNNWDKVAPFSYKNINILSASTSLPTYIYTNLYVKTNLDLNGSVDSSDPSCWFFTGDTSDSTVWLYRDYTGTTKNRYYLGSSGKTDFINIGVMTSGQTMIEGDNIGPILTNEGDNISVSYLSNINNVTNLSRYGYRFYYNTDINKFIILYPIYGQPGTSPSGNRFLLKWVTFNPINDYGNIGNPRSNDFTTSNEQWLTQPFSGSGVIKQYTVSGDSNTVVLAIDKLGISGNTIECVKNSNVVNGFISGCGYSNYKHEITIGSSDSDNDVIGVFLGWFKDDIGLYGQQGLSHNISLLFTLQSDIYEGLNSGVSIKHNFGNNIGGFSGNSETIYYRNTMPFNTNYGYNSQGYVRLRITRSDKVYGSGNGELFKIEMTNRMGDKTGPQPNTSKDIGESNQYNPIYDIEFDISDSSTWTANSNQPKALMKFIGPQKYGYLTMSQPKSQFFDITFSGSQRSVRPTIQTLEASARDNEIIPIIPYDLNCEYIETICSGDFDSTNNTTDLYIDVLDNTNNPSVTFDLTSGVIPDPCPSVIPNICGCPFDVCDQSIRINIKKKL